MGKQSALHGTHPASKKRNIKSGNLFAVWMLWAWKSNLITFSSSAMDRSDAESDAPTINCGWTRRGIRNGMLHKQRTRLTGHANWLFRSPLSRTKRERPNGSGRVASNGSCPRAGFKAGLFRHRLKSSRPVSVIFNYPRQWIRVPIAVSFTSARWNIFAPKCLI